MKTIRISPMCRICETQQSEKNGLCFDCYWIQFGMAEYEAQKKASKFEKALTRTLIFLGIVSIGAFLVWRSLQ